MNPVYRIQSLDLSFQKKDRQLVQGTDALSQEILSQIEFDGNEAEPKTEHEARKSGRSVDRLVTSIGGYANDNGMVNGRVYPTRYSVGTSYRRHLRFTNTTSYQSQLDPRIMRMGLVAPVKFGREYYLLSQWRNSFGHADDAWRLTSLLAGDYVAAESLNNSNPLNHALQSEVKTEFREFPKTMGESPKYALEERQLGNVVFITLTHDLKLDMDITQRLPKSDKVEHYALIPLERQKDTALRLYDQRWSNYTPAEFTKGIRSFLADKKNLKILLEDAGF